MGIEDFLKKKVGRRGFLSSLALAGATALYPFGNLFANKKDLQEGKSVEQKEDFKIVKREEWDDAWDSIKERYISKIGKVIKNILKGRKYSYYSRRVNTFSYEVVEGRRLEDVLNRIIVHHTEMDEESIVGDNSVNQMKFLRDSQILSGFGDIAYHFAITPDRQVFECVPITHLGFHAGHTKETQDYLKKKEVPELSVLASEKEDSLKLENYINAQKMDPDYGSIGIVLLGNLDEKEPTKAQLSALEKLLNKLKSEYKIPIDNIIGHKEVKEKVVEASGLKLTSKSDKTCPGDKFDLKKVKECLEPDPFDIPEKDMLLIKQD